MANPTVTEMARKRRATESADDADVVMVDDDETEAPEVSVASVNNDEEAEAGSSKRTTRTKKKLKLNGAQQNEAIPIEDEAKMSQHHDQTPKKVSNPDDHLDCKFTMTFIFATSPPKSKSSQRS